MKAACPVLRGPGRSNALRLPDRPGSRGRSEIRIIFAFDPTRAALLLLGGDKAGNWKRWYEENIPLAIRLYIDYTSDDEE